MKMKLNDSGVLVPDNRLKAFSVSRANQNPPKRIQQIKNLIEHKSPSICIIRGEGIGDVIMTTPTINALYNLFENKPQITYATNTRYLDGALVKVLQGNNQISKIIDRQNLTEEDYDLVVNLHCPAIGHEKPNAPPVNRIDLFAQHAGVFPLPDTKPKLFLTKEEIGEASYYLSSLNINSKDKVILINLFSSSLTRSLNKETVYNALQELGNLGYKLILTKHDSDLESSSRYRDLPNIDIVENWDIRQLSALSTQVDLLICPDSALLHAAGALDVPTIALFAPTDPRARINYYPQASAIWGGEGINGHPHWYEACPFNNICWRNITSEEIVEKVKNKLFNKQKENKGIQVDLI